MSSGSARVLSAKLSVDDLVVGARTVLVRADLNVPVRDGLVTDRTRIDATLPTLEALLQAGAAVIVMSHRGRPKGAPRADLGMEPVVAALREALARDVVLLPDCVGDGVESAVRSLEPGGIAVLENLRFHAGETRNDPQFAAALAGLGTLYVDDAFGAAHRAHASIAGVPPLVEQAAAGKLLRLEVEMLSRCLDEPAAPFVLVAGGAKVSDKLDAITHLMPLVDRLIIGGAMANAVLAAQGRDMGASRIEDGATGLASDLLEQAASNGVDVQLPEDFVVAPSIDDAGEARIETVVPGSMMALDIGPRTADRFAAALADARTVLWNGPMGVFEVDELAAGTRAIGKAVARLTTTGGLTIVGGGDTAAAVSALGLTADMSHVSTGGGASLELLSGVVLPGIEALTDRSP